MEKQKEKRSGRRLRRGAELLGRALLILLLLPIRILLVGWALLTRFFLLISTALLILYFVVTTVVTGPLVLDLVNQTLLGTFNADHVEVSLFSARVQLFNLRITHPDGHDIIHARRLETSVDALALLFWGAKEAVGVSGPLPLHFRETRLDGYRVVLPFRPEGLRFPEAFLPAVITPTDEPPGPAPTITLSHVVLGQGEAFLDFGTWTMPIEVQRVHADLRIGGGQEFLLTARSVQVSSFRMPGLLPPPVDFVGELPAVIDVARFRMDLEELEAHDARVVHPDFEGLVHDFALNFASEQMGVKSTGEVEVTSPHRLEEVSMGHVFGGATVDFEMHGSITLPDFRFRLRSPRIIAEGLELDFVRAETTLDLHGGVFLNIRKLEAELMGSPIEAWQAGFDMEFGGDPEISFDACFDGIRPALVAAAFDIEELLPYADLLATGCCHGCRIRAGTEELRIDGGISLAVDAGEQAAALSGVRGGTVESFVTWTGDAARWEGLAVTTDIGHISSVGYLRLEPELEGRVDASISLADLADIPLLSVLGLAGEVHVPQVVLSGTPAQPEVRLEASLAGFRVAGETFDTIDLDGRYGDELLTLSSACFRHGGNGGCFQGRARLPLDGTKLLPMPAELTLTEPLTLDLARLPFVEGLPLDGAVVIELLSASGTIHEDWIATVSGLQTRLAARVQDLAVAPAGLSFDAVEVELEKEADLSAGDFEPEERDWLDLVAGLELTLNVRADKLSHGPLDAALRTMDLRLVKMPGTGRDAPGALQASFDTEGLRLADITARRARIQVDLPTTIGLDPDLDRLPLPLGKGRIEGSGFKIGAQALRAFELDLVSRDGPERLAARGAVQLTPQVAVKLDGEVDLERLRAALNLATVALPLRALPAIILPDPARNLLEDTLLTARLEASRIDVRALLAGDLRRLFEGAAARGHVTLSHLEKLPEAVSRIEAAFDLEKGALHFRPLDVRLKSGALLRVEGALKPFQERFSGSVELTPTRLQAFRTWRSLELPLAAEVGLKAHLDGPWTAPELKARLDVREFVAVDIELGKATLDVAGTVGERLDFTSDAFFRGFKLEKGTLSFDGGLPSRLDLTLPFEKFRLQRVLPALPDALKVLANGTAGIVVRLDGGEPFELGVEIPPSQLSACMSSTAFDVCMNNPGPASLGVTSQGIDFRQLRVEGGGHSLFADGRIDFATGWKLAVQADLDLAQLPFLGEALASYEGRVSTGLNPLLFSGAIDAPTVAGSLLLKDAVFMPRQLGSEIAIPAGIVRLSGALLEGRILGLVEEDAPLVGTYDEGSFSLYGWFRLADWMPDDALLYLSGKEIYYQSPGQFRLVVNPRIEFSARNLTDPKGGESRLSGEVYLSEGEFTRNFDRLIGSFATAFSRSQERYSKPITETLPFLKTMQLDLRVRGGNFAVSSRFPFGETELTVNLDLRVGGTLEELKLYDWMRLVPGGTITYKVVKRVFSIIRGSVDFAGAPEAPYIDIEAVTEVPYQRSSGRDSVSSAAALGLDEEAWGETIPIKIRLTGTYPNLKPEFSSEKAGFDDADLQTLLLLGKTRRDLEGGGDESGVSVNLLTEDVAGMVGNLLLAPFVDTVSLGFTTTGGIMAEAATKIGRAISLSTRVRKDAEEEEYTAGIRFKITDRLSLEGRMKKAADEADSQTLYEAKFKYVIPLD